MSEASQTASEACKPTLRGRVRHREWRIVGTVIHVLGSGVALVEWDAYRRDRYYVGLTELEKA